MNTNRGTGEPRTDVLADTLGLAVPLNMTLVPGWSDRQRHQYVKEAADMVTAHRDDLMFGGAHCVATFNALARGLAILAFCPGGVTVFGLHFCAARHSGCANTDHREAT